MPPARDRQLFKGCLRAALRASQSDRNNIPDKAFLNKALLYKAFLPKAFYIKLFIQSLPRKAFHVELSYIVLFM